MTRELPSGGPAGFSAAPLCAVPVAVEARAVPVRAPLPDVARGVVEAEAVGREGARGRGSEVAVVRRVARREVALPDVAAVLAARLQLVAPGVATPLEAAAGRVLPLRLGREARAGPRAVGRRVLPGDVDDRVVHARLDVRGGALRVTPVGAEDLPPPGRRGERARRRGVLRQELLEDERPAVALGVRAIARGGDELGELLVRDGGGVDGEGAQGDGADGALAVLGEALGVVRCP